MITVYGYNPTSYWEPGCAVFLSGTDLNLVARVTCYGYIDCRFYVDSPSSLVFEVPEAVRGLFLVPVYLWDAASSGVGPVATGIILDNPFGHYSIGTSEAGGTTLGLASNYTDNVFANLSYSRVYNSGNTIVVVGTQDSGSGLRTVARVSTFSGTAPTATESGVSISRQVLNSYGDAEGYVAYTPFVGDLISFGLVAFQSTDTVTSRPKIKFILVNNAMIKAADIQDPVTSLPVYSDYGFTLTRLDGNHVALVGSRTGGLTSAVPDIQFLTAQTQLPIPFGSSAPLQYVLPAGTFNLFNYGDGWGDVLRVDDTHFLTVGTDGYLRVVETTLNVAKAPFGVQGSPTWYPAWSSGNGTTSSSSVAFRPATGQNVKFRSYSSGTSSITAPADIVNGDLLVGFRVGTTTVPTGWTSIVSNPGGFGQALHVLFYRYASSEPSSYSFGGAIAAYSNASGGPDVFATSAPDATAAPAITTTVADCLVIRVHSWWGLGDQNTWFLPEYYTRDRFVGLSGSNDTGGFMDNAFYVTATAGTELVAGADATSTPELASVFLTPQSANPGRFWGLALAGIGPPYGQQWFLDEYSVTGLTVTCLTHFPLHVSLQDGTFQPQAIVESTGYWNADTDTMVASSPCLVAFGGVGINSPDGRTWTIDTALSRVIGPTTNNPRPSFQGYGLRPAAQIDSVGQELLSVSETLGFTLNLIPLTPQYTETDLIPYVQKSTVVAVVGEEARGDSTLLGESTRVRKVQR